MVDWDSLKPAFPNGKMGSKILLTTRNKELASYAGLGSHFCYETRNLTEEESWELLCNKAFTKDVGVGCPPAFEKFKREMIEKCCGLPLAVVVLGGILAVKKSLNEWEMVLGNISPYLDKGQQQERILGILALSYTDLPNHLKPCFLYLGIFPEDFSIPVGKLIRLWVAEGLPPQQGGGEETMEDMTQHYLTELIHRCMVQVGERTSMGSFKTCRLHDLMRDLCLFKAREENFLEIYHRGNMMVNDSSLVVKVPPLTTSKSRRLAIHTSPLERHTYMFGRGALNLRSLLFIGKMYYAKLEREQLKFMCKDFKLLRVLELKRVHIRGGLHRDIGMLIHLRYLGLGDIGHQELPPSVCKLQNLQTLYLRSSFTSVPDVIWKMEQLRHLYLPHFGNPVHLRMDTLTNLRIKVNFKVLRTRARSDGNTGEAAKLKDPPHLSNDAYIGTEMVCSAKGFPRLERLLLIQLYSLGEWRVEERSMPSLRHLVIVDCRSLSLVPEG
ncbi:hypothetical protein HHK36_010245 [Tetracentron sinense]|uniref:NB-ARC domain-containing protein n=1 Tax=Tetracentron sinense TaxID=13715 RepID=A0A834ZEM4_TETSI|nr:hypothetical protein HHK36_010245 [Tetracentron sinense]